MQQLTFHGPGLLRWESVPEPTLSGPKAALVRPIAVAGCDLDTALMQSRVPLPGPFPLGHEFVGEVVEVGADVSLREGQRVAVPFQISCGECRRCRAGLTANCETVPPRASYGLGVIGGLEWGGALTDLVEVPFADAMMVEVPEDLAPAHLASLSDNMPDAYRAVSSAGAGDEVLVVGGGSIGLYATALAIGRGARVTYVDSAEARCEIAQSLGADVEHGELSRPSSPRSLVVHTSADAAQLRNAVLSTDHGGTCVDTGIYFTASVPLPMLEMYGTGVTLTTGRAHARRDMDAVLAEITAGRFDPSAVTTVVADWADAAEAFATPTTKVVVTR